MSDELNQTTVKRESDLFISRMITDRTGWHKVLLPINQNYDKFVKETRHRFYIFIKKKKRKETINLVKCNTTTHADDVFCPLTLAWCINFLFNCPITLSNQKHDVYSILLVLKSGWWSPIMFENFIVLIDIEMLACVGGWKKFGSRSALVEYFKQLNMLYVGVSY